MKILCSAALVATIILFPSAALARQYVVRTIAGTVETRGWEQSLLKHTPNLNHWHWEPVRDSLQTVQRITPGSAPHLTGTPAILLSQSDNESTPVIGIPRHDNTPYVVVHPVLPKKPYITLQPAENKSYIVLPKQEKPRAPYIVPTSQKDKGPYIYVPDRKQIKQTYITLYEQPPKGEYIKLSGKMMPPHNNPYVELPLPSVPVATAEHLSGKLTPAASQDAENQLHGRLSPSASTVKPVVYEVVPKVATNISPDDTEFASAWAAASSKFDSKGLVAGRMLTPQRTGTSRSFVKHR